MSSLLLFNTFMQGIYNYMPKTMFLGYTMLQLFCGYDIICNAIYHDKRFVLYISTLWSACGVPHMAVFSSSLMLCCPGMLLRYFLFIIIIIHLYSGNLQLYIWNKPLFFKRSDHRTLLSFQSPLKLPFTCSWHFIIFFCFNPVRSQPAKMLFQISSGLF